MMDFVYTLQHPNNMITKYTTSNEEARIAWCKGFKVTCHNVGFRKFYKHTSNIYQCEDGAR